MDKLEFYERIARRPLIDIKLEPGEAEATAKQFKDSNQITLYSWRNDWLANAKANLEHFKYFNRDHAVKVFFNEYLYKPMILVGAGPSLENNIGYLKMAKEAGIPIMATSHALMYLSREDIRVKPDFTVVLDAGKMWGEYFGDLDFFKDVPLFADFTCNTEHLKMWKGPVYFYKSAHPQDGDVAKFLKMEMDRVIPEDKYPSVVEVGGHAMGAMISIARGIMRCNTIIFAGTDYSFSLNGKFYPFDFKIDQVVDGKDFGAPGKELPAPPPPQGGIFDIFGNMVGTNGAYLQFKNVLDHGIKQNILVGAGSPEDLEFINASEGGALGALNGGNSKFMRYLRLEDAIYYADAKRKIPREVN